ncbi:hypothetical protein [Streptacidiphilus cavernicola]|uniref:PQQ-binding-like beta-propeller repeat protein n=1 Tax=Streptacidiphilus cavernicola TaxID=3342716 RepID=A0ABV6W1E6_9ACTN
MRARRGARTYARAGIRGAIAAAVLLLACGCGGGTGGGGADGSATLLPTSTLTPPADPAGGRYNPPTRFAAHGVRLPTGDGNGNAGGTGVPGTTGAPGHSGTSTAVGTAASPLPIALHGADAYIAGTASLEVVDTGTGKTLDTIRPQGRPLADANSATGATAAGPVSAPLVAVIGDSTLSLALVPFLVTAAAQGSTPAGTGVELDAVDTSTRQTVWTATVGGLPAWASDGTTADLGATVVGVTGNVAVVRVSGTGVIGTTLGIDLMKHQILWHQDGFAAEAVTGGMAVGRIAAHTGDPIGKESAVAALDATDGTRVWKELDADTVGIGPAAPGKVVVTGTDYGDGSAFAYLVDTADGKKAALPRAGTDPSACTYDGASMLLCTGHDSTGLGGSGDRLFGLDAASGKLVWQLPTAPGRAVPTVTAAWHGAVYGSTAAGPVVLNARTGADRGSTPGIAPSLLDGDVGLTAPTTSGAPVTAYPAIG